MVAFRAFSFLADGVYGSDSTNISLAFVANALADRNPDHGADVLSAVS